MSIFAMMKYVFPASGLLYLLCFSARLSGQHPAADTAYNYTHVYHPYENADSAFEALKHQAAIQHKRILIFVGGNWCIWCARLHQSLQKNDSVRNFMDSHYITWHLNYSPENRNPEMMSRFRHPETLGFPAIVITDENGQLLTVQSTEPLKDAYSYSPQKEMILIKSFSSQNH